MIFDTAGLSSGDDGSAPTNFLRNRVGVQLKIAKSSTEESLRGKRRGSALSHPHIIPHRRLAMPQLDGVRVRFCKDESKCLFMYLR